jgi:OOP family OmpA-OmpF porin
MRGLVLAAATAVTLASCGSPQPVADTPLPGGCDVVGPVVVAAGGRANMPAPSVQPLTRYLQSAATAGSAVTVVDTGGTPQTHGSVSFQATAANDVAAQEQRKAAAQRLSSGLEATVAASEGAAPLEALDVAARHIHSASDVGTIVLVDSGLQTQGILDYTQEGMLRAEPTDLVDGVQQSGQLPELSGVRVFVIGLGDTAAPQESLDTASRGVLVEQWSALLSAAGAACVGVDPQPLTGASPAVAPAVPTVSVPDIAPLVPATKVVLTADSVAFVSDSAQLRDPELAKNTLGSIAEALVASGQSVMLTGTTATDGTEAGRLELSRLRAETVKTTLVDLGVPAARITTRGVGTNHPEHVDDIDADGRLIPAKAARNRTVILEVQP